MNRKLLLIDFENVQQVNLAHLDENYDVVIFVGVTQKSVPIELVVNSQKLGNRVDWQRVDGNGSNALDFYVACHLGRVLEKSPSVNCIVLSKDKGFDPLIRHLNKIGLKCSRINSLMELEPPSSKSEEPNFKRVMDVLSKTDKKTRPRKRKTLSQYISTIFQNKIPKPDIDRIIDILFANKMISEINNTISYDF